MPDIVRPVTSPVLTVITEAIAWSVVEGIPIRLNDLVGHGVVCTSSHARTRWERDRRQPGVDVIGLCILKAQPDSTSLPEAAAQALGVSLPHAEGLADGMEASPHSSVWEASHARHRYAAGFEIGVLVRMSVLASVCLVHGNYEINLRRCPLCVAGHAADLERLAARGDC